jgi:thioredoxin-related protein
MTLPMPAQTLPAQTLPARASLSRRHLLAGALLACSVATRTAHAALAQLPVSVSLADELKLALAKGSPLVVMVSLGGCPFCHVVRNNFLGPMLRDDGLPVVQVDMRNARALRDFAGAASTHDQMTRAWGIKVAPTVLFFGKGGVEIAERMVGAYLPDFYGAYLDDRLQQARRILRAG